MFTVLMVENPHMAEILESAFPEELRLCPVQDIPSLLHWLHTDCPDIVILDLDLPGSRKPETAAYLQSRTQKSVVIFAADQNFFDPSHPLTAVPAADYLLRPYEEEELLLTMETALHLCEQERQAAEAESGETLRLSLVRDRIELYVREHYGEDLSMQGVAQVMNYSETHFCRLFKQCFKVNFSVYLNEYRVEQAKQMLLLTNRSVKEIARHCGYQDNSYFIRVFKRFTNMTPMDYRLSMQSITRK